MTHGEFITKMQKCGETVLVFNLCDKSYQKAAMQLEVNYRTVSAQVGFFKRHESTQCVPWLSGFPHKDVVVIVGAFNLTDKAGLRAMLTEKFCPTTRGIQPPIESISQLSIRKLMKMSGLEHFRLNGRWYIHWKHAQQNESTNQEATA